VIHLPRYRLEVGTSQRSLPRLRDDAGEARGGRMNAPKVRPRLGTPVTADMSVRDIAAALGVSKTELGRWCDLGRIPEDEFERRIAQERALGGSITASAILGGVPARGRVTRALSMFRGMSVKERAAFLSGIGIR